MWHISGHVVRGYSVRGHNVRGHDTRGHNVHGHDMRGLGLCIVMTLRGHKGKTSYNDVIFQEMYMLHKWKFMGAVMLVVIIVAVTLSIYIHITWPSEMKISSKEGVSSNKTLVLKTSLETLIWIMIFECVFA